MIIYNITMHIAEEIQPQWIQWVQTQYIPQSLETQCFLSARLVKVLVNEEMGGITYSIQLLAPNHQALEKYKNTHEDTLQKKGIQLFGDKMLFFKTDLEIIQEY